MQELLVRTLFATLTCCVIRLLVKTKPYHSVIPVFTKKCSLSGWGSIHSRPWSFYIGRSTFLSTRCLMDDRAWSLQDSWICRHPCGVLSAPLTKRTKWESYLLFKGESWWTLSVSIWRVCQWLCLIWNKHHANTTRHQYFLMSTKLKCNTVYQLSYF